MRQIVPYIFWPWFATSCFILLRRRVTGGSWKAIPREPEEHTWAPPPLPTEPDPTEPDPAPEAATSVVVPAGDIATAADPVPAPASEPAAEPATGEQADADAPPAPVMTDVRPRARSLAEALEGIAMPCDLSPLIGTGEVDHREVAFFTSGFEPTTVGEALADEFERLGYEITPVDDRSIRAARGEDRIRATLMSEALVGDAVMADHHPSAPAGALVVELKLAP